jgi:hypothetical protein
LETTWTAPLSEISPVPFGQFLIYCRQNNVQLLTYHRLGTAASESWPVIKVRKRTLYVRAGFQQVFPAHVTGILDMFEGILHRQILDDVLSIQTAPGFSIGAFASRACHADGMIVNRSLAETLRNWRRRL